jgi:hypothetical protein
VTGAEGQTVEILCIGQDITEGVTAQIKYAETSHKMDANMLGLVYLFDYENPSDEFNQTLLRSMKLSANELDKIIHRIVAMTQEL